MDNQSYLSYLSSLLDCPYISDEHKDLLTINIYQTLLNLNHNYQEEFETTEVALLEDYLRKLNNLKVKIQLKRKPEEITSLMEEILNLYHENKSLIDKYNTSNLDILDIIDTKDPQDLTKLIDTETKEKMRRQNQKSHYDKLRNKLTTMLPISRYQVNEGTLTITNAEDHLEVSLKDFYQVFEYLLNIDNYPQPLLDNHANRHHTIMVANILKFLTTKDIKEIDQIKIPLILSYLVAIDSDDINEIDTSKFKIANIKISDLYALAKENNNVNPERTPSWRKISIPNTYLYQKIKEITLKGTYYIEDDNFIFENIAENISDFKISISLSDMTNFLKDNLAKHASKVTLTK